MPEGKIMNFLDFVCETFDYTLTGCKAGCILDAFALLRHYGPKLTIEQFAAIAMFIPTQDYNLILTHRDEKINF